MHISAGGVYTELLSKLQAKCSLQRHISYIIFVVENTSFTGTLSPLLPLVTSPRPSASSGRPHTVVCVHGPWVMHICIDVFWLISFCSHPVPSSYLWSASGRSMLPFLWANFVYQICLSFDSTYKWGHEVTKQNKPIRHFFFFFF